MESLDSHRVDESPFEALIDFLWIPWFNRLWVMQEVVVGPAGKDGACGSSGVTLATKGVEFSFDRLATIVNAIEENKNTNHLLVDKGHRLHSLERINQTPYGVLATQHFRQLRSQRARNEVVSLQQALSRSSNFRTSNIHDSLYAVLGLTASAQEPALYPDYQAPLIDVCLSFNDVLLKNQDEYPFLLHQAGIGRTRKQPDLPSWLPDFTCATDTKVILHKYPKISCQFEASGSHPVRYMEADRSSGTLTVKAIEIDAIEVHPQASYASAHNSYRDTAPSSKVFRPFSDKLNNFIE